MKFLEIKERVLIILLILLQHSLYFKGVFMVNGVKLPNCCYVCLKEPTLIENLAMKKLKFKSFVSYHGDTIQGVSTYSISEWSLPICHDCLKKDVRKRVISILLLLIIPISAILLNSLLLSLIISIFIKNPSQIVQVVSGAIGVIVLSLSLVPAIKIFRARKSFGLDKQFLLQKKVRFLNHQYQEAFEAINFSGSGTVELSRHTRREAVGMVGLQ